MKLLNEIKVIFILFFSILIINYSFAQESQKKIVVLLNGVPTKVLVNSQGEIIKVMETVPNYMQDIVLEKASQEVLNNSRPENRERNAKNTPVAVTDLSGFQLVRQELEYEKIDFQKTNASISSAGSASIERIIKELKKHPEYGVILKYNKLEGDFNNERLNNLRVHTILRYFNLKNISYNKIEVRSESSSNPNAVHAIELILVK